MNAKQRPATLEQFPLITAIVTPLDQQGKVDYQNFAQLLKAQEQACNAVVILGSTGEALNLDEAERREIVRFAFNQNLKIPMMVGVGGVNINETISWIKYLEAFPIEALLLVVPLYAKPGVHGQYHWFKTLMDNTTKPCMLYNVPGRSATLLQFETVKMLKDHPRFWAIKEASGKPEDFKKYGEMAGPQIRLYSGDDALLPAFMPHHCVGLVSVASNVWPAATHCYVDLCLKGKLEEVKNWEKWSNLLFIASNPVPVKRLMFELGQIKTPKLRLPLTHEDLSNADPLTKANNEVANWLQQHS